MYYGATPDVFRKAEILRNHMTEAEQLLWNQISNRKLMGFRFRRQHPINRFIADFYCHKVRLVIELDGSIHDKQEVAERDEAREFMIKSFGINVIRFKNDELINDLERVITTIRGKLNELSSTPL